MHTIVLLQYVVVCLYAFFTARQNFILPLFKHVMGQGGALSHRMFTALLHGQGMGFIV